jgi:hypothetical protein
VSDTLREGCAGFLDHRHEFIEVRRKTPSANPSR